MRTTFRQMTCDELPPAAVKFLHDAYLASPAQDQNFWEILRLGHIYIFESDHVVGAMCIETAPGLVNIVLLGGENIDTWKDDFLAWGNDYIARNRVEKVLILGRSGWGRMFKSLKVIGTLYSA